MPRRFLFLLIPFTCLSLFAEDPAPALLTEKAVTPESAIQLVELFNVEKQAGKGSLELTLGEKKETIAFGLETGHYGLGMVFPGSTLPDQYGKEFKKEQVIQVALGVARSKLQGQLPQFGALSIIASKLPETSSRFKLMMPAAKDAPSTNIAFLLFSSPTTPIDRSDEEKLKGTLFAMSGSVTFTSQTKWQVKEIMSQGKRLEFKVLWVRMEVDAVLGTPFTSQSGTLTGALEFPLYLPHGKPAERVTRQIATTSMGPSAESVAPKAPPKRTPKKPSTP